jgi:hypothetical protein
MLVKGRMDENWLEGLPTEIKMLSSQNFVSQISLLQSSHWK